MIYIKIFLLARLIITFAPIGWLLDLLPNNLFKYIIVVLTTCLKCCMTWLAYAMTGDIFIAALSALLGETYTYFENIIGNEINKWRNRI